MSTETLEKVAQLVKAAKNLNKYLDDNERSGTLGSATANSGKVGGAALGGYGAAKGVINGFKSSGVVGAAKHGIRKGLGGAVLGGIAGGTLGSAYGLARGAKRALMGQHSVSQHELERRHKHSMNKD